MAKVSITTASHTIEIEQADSSAEDLSRLALDLWQKTRDPKLDRATGVGFSASTERADSGDARDIGWRG